MRVRVEIWESEKALNQACIDNDSNGLIRTYWIEHDDPVQRRALGGQVRNAFEAGQCVLTYPEPR